MLHRDADTAYTGWWRERQWLWRNSTMPRSRDCRRVSKGAGVSVVVQGGTARTRGTWVCGSVWGCPQCAAAVQRPRRAALAIAASLMVRPVMVTLTLRHHKGERLRTVRDRVRVAWRKATSGKRGFRGDYARVFEVTTGAGGGFHPHLHVLCERADAQGLVDAWLRNADAERGAVDITEIAHPDMAAEYLAGELLGSKTKGRSQWALLKRATEGDDEAALLFGVVERDMAGVRQITWSRGFGKIVKAAVADQLGIEDLDDVVSLAERDEFDDGNELPELHVVLVEPIGWEKLTRRGQYPRLMGSAASGDWAGVVLALERGTDGEYALAPWVQLVAQMGAPKGAVQGRLFT